MASEEPRTVAVSDPSRETTSRSGKLEQVRGSSSAGACWSAAAPPAWRRVMCDSARPAGFFTGGWPWLPGDGEALDTEPAGRGRCPWRPQVKDAGPLEDRESLLGARRPCASLTGVVACAHSRPNLSHTVLRQLRHDQPVLVGNLRSWAGGFVTAIPHSVVASSGTQACWSSLPGVSPWSAAQIVTSPHIRLGPPVRPFGTGPETILGVTGG